MSRPYPESLRYISQRASNAFVGGNKDSLSSALKDAVEQHDLNPEQKKRVVEMTNRLTWQTMYDSSDDKTFQFDPVKVEDVSPPEPVEIESSVPSGELTSLTTPSEVVPIPIQGHIVDSVDPAKTPLEFADSAKAAAQEFRANRWGALDRATTARADFIDSVVDARMKNDTTGTEIVTAVGALSTNEKAAAELIKAAFDRVRDVGLIPALDGNLPSVYEVDTDHPVAKAYVAYEEAVSAIEHAEASAAFMDKVASGAKARARLAIK